MSAQIFLDTAIAAVLAAGQLYKRIPGHGTLASNGQIHVKRVAMLAQEATP